uniref:Uncharacterized protein n=1 Tax=viral metagenome TaxID=1070528 RepID=A0A6C0KJ51_9ZZZZ
MNMNLGNMKKRINDVLYIMIIYLIWSIVHVIACTTYIKLCAPMTIFGIMTSGFMTTTPHCKAINWVIVSTSHMFDKWFISFSTWCMLKMNNYGINQQPINNEHHD